MANLNVPLAVIGGGTMGSLIVQGALAAGLLTPSQVVIAEPDATKHPALAPLGVRVVTNPSQAVEHLPAHAQLLLAIKPQSLASATSDLSPALAKGSRRVVITILAGTPTHKIAAALGPTKVTVIRAMPNTPASIGQGMTAIALGESANDSDAAFCSALFTALGQVVRIDEPLMDAFTAVAGSGPAYLFFLAQAMTDAATSLGIDATTSRQIVTQTLRGAGQLLAASSDSPDILLNRVQSKGGTTEAAIRQLESSRVAVSIIAAITAARNRGRELSSL